MVGRQWYWGLVLVVLFVNCSSKEDKKSISRRQVVAQLPVGNPEEGKALYINCKTCHGDAAQGNQQLHAPALANTEGWYLYRQLVNFHKGIRGYSQFDTLGYQMAAMAKTLEDSIAINHVVAYIKTMPAVYLPTIINGDIKKGERTYQSTCGSCHGQGAKGNEKMNAPRLNGLDDWYLKTQIYKFKNSIRGSHPSDQYGAQMISMMTLLGDEQTIDDVIAYIRSTNQIVRE